MHNQKGFTLVELVVVIVILGILSAVAVPKFMDMQDEAKQAAIEGARGSVKSAVSLVHAKWLAAGEPYDSDGATNEFEVEGTTVAYDQYGYPTADTDGIMAAAGLADDFSINTDVDPAEIYRTSDDDGGSPKAGAYYFTYEEAGADTAPEVSEIETKQ
jgi:MSHA pilin protein MshA